MAKATTRHYASAGKHIATRVLAFAFVASFALQGCGSQASSGNSNHAADSIGGATLAQAQANCSTCDPSEGCIIFCADNAETQCTQSCGSYGEECTQDCFTSGYPYGFFFCPGGSGTCAAFPGDETGCSSYVYGGTPANCGMCGTNCASCDALTCTCADGTTPDLATDPNNCGGCGNVCPSGVCAGYACSN